MYSAKNSAVPEASQSPFQKDKMISPVCCVQGSNVRVQ